MPYYRLFCFSLLAFLGACATYQSIPPNATVEEAESIMGKPDYECQKSNGVRRLVWTYQPMGQYAYGTNILPNGHIEKVESLLTDESFSRLGTGTWITADVLCEFGPPAEKRRVGLGEKDEAVWSYRYKESNFFPMLMHVYLGKNGDQVTHFHRGPDPLYEGNGFFRGF